MVKVFCLISRNTSIHLLIVMFFLLISCSKSSDNLALNTCDPNVSYARTILPILNTNCNTSGCHDDITTTALNNYQIVHDGAMQIKISIIAGRMPKNKVLQTSEKNAILCWVDNGAKNN